jgi:hypothetical protein
MLYVYKGLLLFKNTTASVVLGQRSLGRPTLMYILIDFITTSCPTRLGALLGL